MTLCALISTGKAQTPCFSIKNNNTTCNAEISWETVDASHNTVGGATNVTLSASGTIYITGAVCTGAADIHVSIVLWGGVASGQIQSVNGVVLSPPHVSETGNNGSNCNNGNNWNIDWNVFGSANPVLIW
ncbi:MAG TPA: hypothetical protein PLQ93_11800 [Bacteroidia bacterium]|nr:hypothetical protein [Bacteroidia bacterium]